MIAVLCELIWHVISKTLECPEYRCMARVIQWSLVSYGHVKLGVQLGSFCGNEWNQHQVHSLGDYEESGNISWLHCWIDFTLPYSQHIIPWHSSEVFADEVKFFKRRPLCLIVILLNYVVKFRKSNMSYPSDLWCLNQLKGSMSQQWALGKAMDM